MAYSRPIPLTSSLSVKTKLTVSHNNKDMASQYKGYYRYPYFRPNRVEFYDICISESDNVISNFEKWNRYRPINHFIGNPDYKQWTPQGRLGTFFNTVDRNKMPTDMIYKIHKQGFYYENNLNIIKCHKCDSTYCSDTIGNITPCHWPHCDYVCASKDRCRTNSNDNYETKMTRKPLYNARNQTNISDALIPTIKLSMQYCKKTIQGWIIDEEAGRDIAKDMKEAKDTSKKISDIKNSMCIRCGSEPPGIVFQNCYHCVTCCRCSECIDYCPKCDAYIMCRVGLDSGKSMFQCDRCTTFSAQVITHDCKNAVFCQQCSHSIDFCPQCDNPI